MLLRKSEVGTNAAWGLYFLVILNIVLLFSQNFLFSSSFGLLQLREVDDLAFQISLREIHQSIFSHNWRALLNLNFYGYGWLFVTTA